MSELAYAYNLITSLKEILRNTKLLDTYLSDMESKTRREYALDRIKNGVCFLAVINNGMYRFYPSRFIGYINNSMEAHEKSYVKDGRATNVAISRVLGSQPQVSEPLEHEYIKFCNSLRIKPRKEAPFGAVRKYWVISQ